MMISVQTNGPDDCAREAKFVIYIGFVPPAISKCTVLGVFSNNMRRFLLFSAMRMDIIFQSFYFK